MENKEESKEKLESNISEILTEITRQNSKIEYNPDDPFSKEQPLKMSINNFLKRIKKYSKLEKSTLIIILIYSDRMCTTSGIILNPYNIHNIILGCLILAIKYNQDFYYTNAYYAKVGGVSVDELNAIEYFAFQLIDFNLFVKKDIYQNYLEFISNYKKK